MREILFKAKRTDNGKWVEGLYVKSYDMFKQELLPFIIRTCRKNEYLQRWYNVDRLTVCQYTGINDKYGKPIFENDIVTIENTKKQGLPGVIVYNRLSASFELAREGYNSIRLDYFEDGKSEFVVVGNIFDKENKK